MQQPNVTPSFLLSPIVTKSVNLAKTLTASSATVMLHTERVFEGEAAVWFFGESASGSAGTMPSTFDPSVVSGMALVTGFSGGSARSQHRWLAPFRSK